MKRVLTATALVVFSLLAPDAMAAKHALTKVNYNATTGITYIDMVVSVDWDFNTPPSQLIEGVNTPLDKTYIQNVLSSSSELLYTMTEGKMRLGKVSVYGNSVFIDNADIQIFNKEGRANAHLSGLNRRGFRTEMFVVESGTPYTPFKLGQVIAHEFGHYVLAVADEYREPGKLDTSNIGSPQDRDTPRNTIMNDQAAFSSLSTSADYADSLQRQTAHFRSYGMSAWETLVSDPKNDTDYAKTFGRVWYDSFKNIKAPTTLTHPKDPAAARADMRMAYMDGTLRGVIVIDLGSQLPESIAGFIKAAEASIDAMVAGSQVAVMTVSGTEVKTLVPLTTFPDSVKTEATRARVKASVASVVAGPTATASLDSVLTQAAILASPLAAARDAATKAGTPLPESNSVDIVQTPVITLYATNSSTITAATGTVLTDGEVTLNSVLLDSGAGDGNVALIVGISSGRLAEAKTASDLMRKSVQITNESEGKMVQALASTEADSLATTEKLPLKITIGSNAIDGDVTITAYTGSNSGLDMTLTSPTGGLVTVANAIAFGITSEVDLDEGTVIFKLPGTLAGRAGDWTATLTASKATTEAVSIEASVASNLTVKTEIKGGTAADPSTPILTATVSQPMAVKGAIVTAKIYDMNHVLIKDGIVLKDDGVAPDIAAGDGVYTASLAGVLSKAGAYEIDVYVSNAGLTAKYGTAGARISGGNAPDVVITQNFVREDGTSFVFVPAAAVTANATSLLGSSGGGCTLGRGSPFDPLFPALVAGAALYWFRRNKKR